MILREKTMRQSDSLERASLVMGERESDDRETEKLTYRLH